MKVIELAEKVKNNEIMPKHIRYGNEDLYFDGCSYYDEEGNNDILDILAMYNSNLKNLFDEVEIIEEDKKLEKIKTLNATNVDIKNKSQVYDFKKEQMILDIQTLQHWINKIIDYLEEKEQC